MKDTEQNDLQLLTPRGLERRLKRHLFKSECTFLAITTPGFEDILTKEIQGLGNTTIREQIDGGVIFSGEMDLVYKTNLYLRTANRILLRIESFTARSYPELYNKSRKIAWELYTGFHTSVSFSVSSRNSRLHHTANIESAVFDAMHETMDKLGVELSNQKKSALCFYIRFSDDICTISIDTSGELLYKRGYRTEVAHAPIRETLAASLLITAHWDKYKIIADPMCGSGVFVFESALMAMNRPVGIDRSFAFEQWPSFNANKWENVKKNANAHANPNIAMKLIASDIDSEAVNATRKNLINLKSTIPIEVLQQDCLLFNKTNQYGEHGLIISNLPYGKRVGASDDLTELHRKLSTHYRRYCKKWDFGFVTSDKKFPKIAEFHVMNELSFVNGGIPVYFFYGHF